MDHEHATHSGPNDQMAMKMDMAKRPYGMFAANLHSDAGVGWR